MALTIRSPTFIGGETVYLQSGGIQRIAVVSLTSACANRSIFGGAQRERYLRADRLPRERWIQWQVIGEVHVLIRLVIPRNEALTLDWDQQPVEGSFWRCGTRVFKQLCELVASALGLSNRGACRRGGRRS